MKNSYRNPFSGINAVTLDDQAILDYWCSPFVYRLFSEIKETDIYEDPSNIVFMGGRSTGKTMFLRYWSFPVQLKLACQNKANNKAKRIIDYFKEKKGLGFYIRIDGPVLRSFDGFGIDTKKWNSIFTHYFELIVGRNYIEAIKKLYDLENLKRDEIEDQFIPEVRQIINEPQIQSLEALLSEFDNRIKEVDRFRGNIPFFKNDFIPSKGGFASQCLSFGIPEIAKKTISELKESINFILLIDEYENYLEPQQRVINTLLRFSKNEIRFRIGMRLEGFRTFNMISEDDFIKEGREYRKVIFEEVLIKDEGYYHFLKEVSKKRLESVSIFKENGKIDIAEFLSKTENLEEEALELVSKNPGKHFDHFKKFLTASDIDAITYKENPLLELLNILWVLRGVKVDEVKNAMEDYLNGNKTGKNEKKYHMDYVDKYKLSLMFLLCSIYRKHKKYYSFNTFSFLSSGIVGNFIELCRRSFQYAEFENKDLLIKEGKISNEQQTKAASDFSAAELQQINRIEKFGGIIYKFINNIGNIFRDFHKDKGIRYPETNQFSADIDNLPDQKFKDAMKAAIRWSVIQKKPNLQQSSPGKYLEDIYTINRIFSPSFQISYRTRGGHSVKLTASDIIKLMSEENVSSKDYLKQMNDESGKKFIQKKLFV
ncbi:MAG: hypothetical protein E3K37_12570 [Candidatus Kuenenia sp.]|nr:hypothetical protein [Candidatus Kuenenia hertensis]